MNEAKLQQWLKMRRRVAAEARAVAALADAYEKGNADREELSVRISEVRALRAISRSLFRESLKK